MLKICWFVALLFLPLPLHALGGDNGQVIKICGSGDSQVLLRNLGQAYEKLHPGIRVQVPDSIGSSGGVKATAGGQCDLGRTARPLKKKEKRFNLIYKVFARSPVVFVVSANLESVRNLTSQQVVSIFAGKIRSWQDIGGPSGKIYVANREKGDSSRTIIEKHLIDFALIEKPVGATIYSTPETMHIIATHDNTIAYGPLAAVKTEKGVRVLAYEGVIPDIEALGAKEYPLFSEFGLVWRQDVSALALNFVKFLDTHEARKIIYGYGAAPVVPEKI
ncbi:MAG: substrate-binding domain-containing protein [Thermodesulfobacteriota bacterium]